jgi:hypothetical protein
VHHLKEGLTDRVHSLQEGLSERVHTLHEGISERVHTLHDNVMHLSVPGAAAAYEALANQLMWPTVRCACNAVQLRNHAISWWLHSTKKLQVRLVNVPHFHVLVSR